MQTDARTPGGTGDGEISPVEQCHVLSWQDTSLLCPETPQKQSRPMKTLHLTYTYI